MLGLLVGACCSCSKPMVTDPALPGPKGSPEIFLNYSKKGDAKLAGGWASGMDMSGVAFDERMTATLISRRHVVMAAHFIRKVGDRVVFHDRQGKFLERKLVKVEKVYADIAVGLLDQPMPAQFRSYPLPVASTDTDKLIGRPVVVTDQHRRIFFHKIRRFSKVSVAFEYDKEDKHGWGKKLIAGDSGNPSFLIVGRELVLLETHTGGGAGTGPYYGSPINQEKLRAVMAAMDPKHTFRTVKVE